jgi:hypothetical protein
MTPTRIEPGTYTLNRSFHLFVRSMEIDPQTKNSPDANVFAYDPVGGISHYIDLWCFNINALGQAADAP